MQSTQQQLQQAIQIITELERKLGDKPPPPLDQPYSLQAEERRQAARSEKKANKNKGRRGRIRTQDKIDKAERREAVYPEGVAPELCRLSHIRPVWRLENNRAVLVAYEIYRSPKGEYGRIPGVLGRAEFALEIMAVIAHLVYVVGLSFDKVCSTLQFFQNLQLRKSQVDALLRQLAREWERQFEALCTLVANSMVVHADETSWSINSVWAFLSEKGRVLLFGVHKDAETLAKILDPKTFAGLVISDDAAVYANFTQSQKCWAHLLRKAIKLALQAPKTQRYRDLVDGLLAIYRAAVGLRDASGGDARARQVAELETQVTNLCYGELLPESATGLEHDYRLLVDEIMRLLDNQQLFTFVLAKAVKLPNGERQKVSGTNNEVERELRGPAEARKTGRTSKTASGARRQTIICSVLQSLRLYLPTYTLTSVIQELQNWWHAGVSCFEKLLRKLKLHIPDADESYLNRFFPKPALEPSG